MDDQSLLRYNRQIMLPQIDIDGQQKLNQAHILILGLGGLGSLASMYLASSGIGELSLFDFDIVDLSNLQRQLVHHTADIGKLKVESARETLKALNPNTKINCNAQKLTAEQLAPYLDRIDMVLDCSDNFQTRYELNLLCFERKIPLISGSAIGFQGQISVFDFRQTNSPCYQCLYSNIQDKQTQSCVENGVLGPVVGVIASMQALEAIKTLLSIGENLCGYLLVFDGLNSEWKKLKLKPDPLCPTCGNKKPQD